MVKSHLEALFGKWWVIHIFFFRRLIIPCYEKELLWWETLPCIPRVRRVKAPGYRFISITDGFLSCKVKVMRFSFSSEFSCFQIWDLRHMCVFLSSLVGVCFCDVAHDCDSQCQRSSWHISHCQYLLKDWMHVLFLEISGINCFWKYPHWF